MKKLFRMVPVLICCAGPAFAGEPLVAAPAKDIVPAVKEVVDVLQKYGLQFDTAAARTAAIDAIIQTADPLGRLLTGADIQGMSDGNKGLLYEVGIRVALTNRVFVIREVKKGTAAEMAGLKTDEVIEELDKGNIEGLRLSDVEELLRGPADISVLLKVRNTDTNAASREVEVRRDPFEAGPIQFAEELPANLCVLKLNGLFARSGKEIVSVLRGWAETERSGVVIDLRGAGGGDAQSVADVASPFAESGSMLFTFRDAQDQDLAVYKSTSSLLLNMPAMILIDENTRGAAEVLAAALAGSTRGVMLIGSTTSGDPLVRDVQSLPDGEQLYIASKRLVVADGRTYNGREGVKPDLVVAPSDAPASEYEPAEEGQKPLSDEEKEDKQLRERVQGDEALRRAVDVLLGLKALNIRGVERAENPTH